MVAQFTGNDGRSVGAALWGSMRASSSVHRLLLVETAAHCAAAAEKSSVTAFDEQPARAAQASSQASSTVRAGYCRGQCRTAQWLLGMSGPTDRKMPLLYQALSAPPRRRTCRHTQAAKLLCRERFQPEKNGELLYLLASWTRCRCPMRRRTRSAWSSRSTPRTAPSPG